MVVKSPPDFATVITLAGFSSFEALIGPAIFASVTDPSAILVLVTAPFAISDEVTWPSSISYELMHGFVHFTSDAPAAIASFNPRVMQKRIALSKTIMLFFTISSSFDLKDFF